MGFGPVLLALLLGCEPAEGAPFLLLARLLLVLLLLLQLLLLLLVEPAVLLLNNRTQQQLVPPSTMVLPHCGSTNPPSAARFIGSSSL